VEAPARKGSKQPKEGEEEAKEPQQDWKKGIIDNYSYSGKEKKACKQCGEYSPFFKNECSHCKYKFPKT